MNSAVIISIVALSILLGINFIEYDVSYVNSSVDGSVHLVRNLPDRGKAANLIAELKRRFKKLVNFLLNKFKKDKINQKKVKRKYLEENILKINFKVETRSLDSHLSRIRKKIKMIHSKIKIISRSENVILSD